MSLPLPHSLFIRPCPTLVLPGALGLLCLAIAACTSDAPKRVEHTPQVAVVSVARHTLPLIFELEGRVRARERSEVRPQVSGILQKRLFEEGDEVRAGDVLYRIDPLLYEAELASAEARLAGARAQLPALTQRLERHRRLIRENAVSKQDSDDVRAAWLAAQAEVKAAEAAVTGARIRLGYTTITAPISGRTGRSLLTPGALLTQNQPQLLTTITCLNPIYVDVTQSARALLELRQELEAGQLHRANAAGTEMQLTLENGADYALPGVLTFTGTQVDEQTGSVTLRASFPNPDTRLLPGMYVRARLAAGTRDALTIPQEAAMRDTRGNAYVYTVNADSKVEARPVTLGRAAAGHWVVEKGLNAGDRVIVEGLQLVRPGLSVQARPRTAKPVGEVAPEAAPFAAPAVSMRPANDTAPSTASPAAQTPAVSDAPAARAGQGA